MNKKKLVAHYATLKTKYPMIVRYCKIMGSYDYWLEMILDRANDLDAPLTTYDVNSKRGDNGEAIFFPQNVNDIKNEQLKNDLISTLDTRLAAQIITDYN